MSICLNKRVLVVEDDTDIAELIRLHLEDERCVVDWAGRGDAARRALARGRFDLVVLDRMLPDSDGIELCQWLRGGNDYVPVLMLTARSSETDRVVGLELGADDYLTKPFGIAELLARIRALLRRSEAMRRAATAPREEPIRVGDLSVDPAHRCVTVGGREVALTAKEFDLLRVFASQPGRVFTRAQLLEQVWGYAHRGYEHTVNSHINRLRSKIEPSPAAPRYLLTVWGVGYRFFDPRSDRDPRDGIETRA